MYIFPSMAGAQCLTSFLSIFSPSKMNSTNNFVFCIVEFLFLLTKYGGLNNKVCGFCQSGLLMRKDKGWKLCGIMGVVAIIVKQPPLLIEIYLSGTNALRPKETHHFLDQNEDSSGFDIVGNIGLIKVNNSKYITRV